VASINLGRSGSNDQSPCSSSAPSQDLQPITPTKKTRAAYIDEMLPLKSVKDVDEFCVFLNKSEENVELLVYWRILSYFHFHINLAPIIIVSIIRFMFACIQKRYLQPRITYHPTKHDKTLKSALSACFSRNTYQWYSWKGKSHLRAPDGGKKRRLVDTPVVEVVTGDCWFLNN